MRPAIDGSLLALDERPLDTVHGRFRAHRFHNLTTGQPAVAVATGDITGRSPLLARVHSSCITSEVYGACDCDCAEQLDAALAGFAATARDRMLVQASGNRLTTFEAYSQLGLWRDQRRYDEVAAACRLLGVRAPLRLLTNNPEKVATLRDAGVAVGGHRPLAVHASPYSRHYLDAKSRSGHLLASAGGDAAQLPEPVRRLAPRRLHGVPGVFRLASYLIPLRAP